MMDLALVLNMKVVGNLNILSESYAQNIDGCSSGVTQWGALGLNGNVMKLAQLFPTFFY